ncbi:cupin domain-containing protein [Aquisalimonas sp.]|uniref:cupin domain-containing protein n=1 Tax=Aquisalimonas sp. TaxID=1872621 RepID=UPI0025B9AA6E|nr:cupin domain-containing protein [Aquisalimonas sp.]
MSTTSDKNALPAAAAHLVTHLGLIPHPEGGWYRRIHTGTVPVTRPDGTQRPGITLIHYLLPAGAYSAWHRVDGDEIWHYLDGEPLTLRRLSNNGTRCDLRLGPPPQSLPVIVVPCGDWQAATPSGSWTLTTCAVGPGFAFEGFTLLRDTDGGREWLAGHAPELMALL